MKNDLLVCFTNNKTRGSLDVTAEINRKQTDFYSDDDNSS